MPHRMPTATTAIGAPGAAGERARRGSVVGRADARQQLVRWLLVVVPFVVLFGVPGVPFATMCVALIVAQTALDVAAWARAARAARCTARAAGVAGGTVDYGLGADWVQPRRAGVPYRDPEHAERLARGSPVDASRAIAGNLRVRARGALVSAGACCLVAALAWPGMRKPDHRFYASLAREQEREIHGAANGAAREAGGCPTVDWLKTHQRLAPDFPSKDPWGNPYVIDCGRGTYGDESIRSAGPDRAPGTADDVVYPEP